MREIPFPSETEQKVPAELAIITELLILMWHQEERGSAFDGRQIVLRRVDKYCPLSHHQHYNDQMPKNLGSGAKLPSLVAYFKFQNSNSR